MPEPFQHLTSEQIRSFLTRGHLVIEQCIDPTVAEEWKARAFDRLGYDSHDPCTWVEPRIHMPAMDRKEVKELAPRAWNAICELLGGEDRVRQPSLWGDSFILN